MQIGSSLFGDESPSAVVGVAAHRIAFWAALVALAMSTQYLFQPFVWRNWPIGEVMLGWLDSARNQLLFAVPIAIAVIAVGRVRVAGAGQRLSLLAVAVLIGAFLGNFARLLASGDRFDVLDSARQGVRIAVIAWSIIGILYLWRTGAATVEAAERERNRQAALRAATNTNELEWLKRQIEPHFLFNTLATIRQLHRIDGDAGQRLLARLLAYMERSLASAATNLARLGDEVDLMTAYLDICQSRMAGRLSTQCNVPDTLRNAQVPPLILVTLAENAIKHGIGPAALGGSIRIAARREGEMLELMVSDDGVGLGSAAGGAGIGLANMLRRLRLTFGAGAQLSLSANAPSGVCAQVRMPLVFGR